MSMRAGQTRTTAEDTSPPHQDGEQPGGLALLVMLPNYTTGSHFVHWHNGQPTEIGSPVGRRRRISTRRLTS